MNPPHPSHLPQHQSAHPHDPEGMTAISPGSRSAPGVSEQTNESDPNGVAANRSDEPRWHPSRMQTDADSSADRGCRCAQSPANRCDPSGINTHCSESVPDPQPKSRRKLDAAKKAEICQYVAEGHSLTAAAHLAGVNERTIRRERDRDPFFKLQLGHDKEIIAKVVFTTMGAAAKEKWQAAERFFKIAYPERYYARPHMIPVKQHEKCLGEMVHLFASIATEEQMRKLEQLLGPMGPR